MNALQEDSKLLDLGLCHISSVAFVCLLPKFGNVYIFKIIKFLFKLFTQHFNVGQVEKLRCILK